MALSKFNPMVQKLKLDKSSLKEWINVKLNLGNH